MNMLMSLILRMVMYIVNEKKTEFVKKDLKYVLTNI